MLVAAALYTKFDTKVWPVFLPQVLFRTDRFFEFSMPAVHAPDSIAIVLVCIKVLILSIYTPLAAAHGYVQTVVVAETAYPGWLPFSDPYVRPPSFRP